MKHALSLVAIALVPFSSAIKADLFEPFSTSNLHPFVQLHGLPATRSASLAAQGEIAWQLETAIANHFTSSIEGNEAVVIDGETYRLRATLSYGLTERLEATLTVPYVKHEGGSLDSFIENWHDLFGLPNGGREDVPQDQLNFLHRNTQFAGDQIGLTDDSSGLGDIQFSLGYQLAENDRRSWSTRAGVKFATGDANDLTGSGGTDYFASLHVSDQQAFRHPDWRFHGTLGVLSLGDSEVLEAQLEDTVVFGSGTLAWHTWTRVSLKAQIDFHSAFYDSSLRELGDDSAQLSLGGSILLGEKTFLDISVAEDIITDTAPDVVFQFALRSRF